MGTAACWRTSKGQCRLRGRNKSCRTGRRIAVAPVTSCALEAGTVWMAGSAVLPVIMGVGAPVSNLGRAVLMVNGLVVTNLANVPGSIGVGGAKVISEAALALCNRGTHAREHTRTASYIF